MKHPFESIFGPFKAIQGYQTAFGGMQDGQWYQFGTNKYPRQYFGTVQVKILSQNGPKMDENGEKCQK